MQIYSALKYIAENSVNEYLSKCWHIRDGITFTYSIDNFIDAHRDDAKIGKCGKLAIIKSILDAERDSKLFVDRQVDGTNPSANGAGTWYSNVFRLIQNGVSLSDVDNIFKDASFITFNYDRSIEHYFYNALIGLYGLTNLKRDPPPAIEKLRVLHVYGQVAPLPWQVDGDEISLKFGDNQCAHLLPELMKNIATYTEQMESTTIEGEISDMISKSQTIVFLGFSYLPQNLQLLLRSAPKDVSRRVLGTALGLSPADRGIVERSLIQLADRSRHNDATVIVEPLTCADLIAQYGRFLGSA